MLRFPRSLFGKLLLGQIAIVLIVAIALPLLLSRMLNDTADAFVSARLEREATAFAHGSAVGGGQFARERGNRFFALFDAQGNALVARPEVLPFDLSDLPHGAARAFGTWGRYDVLTRPVNLSGGRSGWVVVAQDRTHPEEIVDDVVRSFLRRFAWVIGAALFGSLLLSFIVLRHVTGMFRDAATDADAIGLPRLDARIEEARMPSEAMPLVHATNRALGRLEAGYRAQGDFIGNVAHELRTPLALISLRLEQLPVSPERDQIGRAVDQANHVIRQLIDLAAIDRLHPQLGMVDSVSVARDAVEAMVPIVYRSGHSIAFEEPDEPTHRVRGVAELLQIAVTNLIDNAVRHTPPGSAIVVSAATDGCLTVEDDGPGLAVDARDMAARRFRRGDTARSDSAGLGLSIVERILGVCGGRLETGSSAAGGALLRLRLDATPLP
ncbi:MAG: HAMP domain-containing sensor histidine kinase [Candidatus Sphingomonas colombiensis]|nr:HAMP domain-containing sensor histidine kinase [Sphingomonas sp.]WEK44695.1 MAG: HAMP domain-containing sensor histidine kinase [Sphingomonas sp.]